MSARDERSGVEKLSDQFLPGQRRGDGVRVGDNLVVVTREGAENGYVTADYDGVTGWVYADLIARQDEVG